jgi:signal transduction histidine kinase
VVQEALHNCSRHADARVVRVTVQRPNGRLALTILDDGKGFDPRHERGLGLLGMEERVAHLGGSFQVDSKPGEGTLISISFPLNS